jgi:hypothetical protein|tara:strand:- start:16200 stop:18059 length:1860 start_codon:yes stop_codon:yes gene_type:complete
MALFLSRTNNLADLENISEARKNLGLGTLAVQNADSVVITGGDISVDNLFFNLSEHFTNEKYLVCDSNGKVNFQYLNLPGWLMDNNQQVKEPTDIYIADFNTSNMFLRFQNVHNVALTGSYFDLDNLPRTLEEFEIDTELDFVRKSSNLADINDKLEARSNLGIGTASLINSHQALNFNNITVDSLFFSNVQNLDSENPNYLYINSSGIVTPTSLLHASTSNYGVVVIASNIYDERNASVPSSTLFKQTIDTIDADIIALQNNVPMENTTINNMIVDSNLMKIGNNLSEITDTDAALSNLGFETNSIEFVKKLNESSTVFFNTVHITSNFIFTPQYSMSANDQYFLTISKNDFHVRISTMTKATPDEYGVVKIITDIGSLIDSKNDEEYSDHTINSKAFYDYVQEYFLNRFTVFSNSIPIQIKDMYSEYMKVDDNIRVKDPTRARQHLLLHNVAYTGDYFNLRNAPSNVSSFSNDKNYLSADSNLSEFQPNDISLVRKNLNIGSVASYDSNNVTFISGTGSFSHLNISNSLIYNPLNNVNIANKYLFCTNNIGSCTWNSLPEATTYSKGIVKLQTNHLSPSDKHASSASALYTAYQQITGQIYLIQNSLEQIKKRIGIT